MDDDEPNTPKLDNIDSIKDNKLLTVSKRAIGVNQTIKLIRSKKARMIFLAKDADNAFKAKILDEINRSEPVPVNAAFNSQELGEHCGIDVECAVVAIY